MKYTLLILIALVVLITGCGNDDYKIDLGNQIIKNINQFQKSKKQLPKTDNWNELENLGFKMQALDTVPTYQKVSDTEYELIYLEGFDSPYLFYNSQSKKWSISSPTSPKKDVKKNSAQK